MQASELGSSKSMLVAEHWKRKHRDKTMRQLNKQNHDQDQELQEKKKESCHRRTRVEAREKNWCPSCSASRLGPPASICNDGDEDVSPSPPRMPFESLIQANNSRDKRESEPRSSMIETNDDKLATITTNVTVNRILAIDRSRSGGTTASSVTTIGMQTNAKTGDVFDCDDETNRDQIDRNSEDENCKKFFASQRRNCFAKRKAIILLLVQQATLLTFSSLLLEQQQTGLVAAFNQDAHQASGSSSPSGPPTNTVGDPRPTIYSGQISFGLLLSAHSSMGAEIVGSASHQIQTIFALEDQKMLLPAQPMQIQDDKFNASSSTKQAATSLITRDEVDERAPLFEERDTKELLPLKSYELAGGDSSQRKRRSRRQIFHNTHSSGGGNSKRAQQYQAQTSKASPSTQQCSQVNPNALYAGMGAIWASHQANLVADSHFTIGTYVYDSCNDADVGQRQSVRIVSNLNAFQQTTCESPRGSPISLTIAHGDDQVKAIHLLTSFRVPVISTKEHFAQEAYGDLNQLQRKYLFSTAPSSRHLALGALRFARRVAAKSASSPKLPNRLHKSSSRNGLVVISRDLPQAFINFLTEFAPQLVNYELLATKLPIDQISSISRLESIFMKPASRASSSMSESRLVETTIGSPDLRGDDKANNTRNKRSSFGGDSSDDASDGQQEPSSGGGNEGSSPKMLSPTILMFITPAEAIDLITRLRNNMAEVSKYYSLIIVTREDITPALKTIFQRGGSTLCSGKAFYTISPKPDDMSEFSRYFRDTVHIEGETSDHPLICEYAKHASSSRIATDYDDVAAEPVIKAVWAAAAAFKQVHSRECGAFAGQFTPALNQNNFYKSSSASSAAATAAAVSSAATTPGSSSDGKLGDSQQSIRSLKSRQSNNSNQPGSNKSPHSECMMKMSKSMSQLVQRALRKINVSINSTGLQSLDGFRVSFDDLNELNSNKFSIRHINKECEIEEIGQYTGQKGSQLHLDNEAISKSLESTLPDAWPVSLLPPTTTTTTASPVSDSGQSPSSNSDSNSNSNQPNSDQSSNDNSDGNSSANGGNPSWLGEQPASTSTQTSRRRRPNQNGIQNNNYRREQSNQQDQQAPGDSSDEETVNTPGDSTIEPSFRHKTIKRSKAPASGEGEQQTRRQQQQQQKGRAKPAPIRATTTASRAHVGLTDTQPEYLPDTTTAIQNTITTTNSMQDVPTTTARPMRKLMPYPSTEGAKLKDWIPREAAQGGELTKQRPTTKQPVYHHSTLPESGGNTDLEIPALLNSRPPKIGLSNKLTQTTQQMQNNNENENPNSSASAESGDFVTMASVIDQGDDSASHETTSADHNGNLSATYNSNSSSYPNWATHQKQATLKAKYLQQTAAGGNMGTAATTVSSVIMKPFGRQGFSFDLGDASGTSGDQQDNQHNSMAGKEFRSPFRDVDFLPVALSSEAPSLPITTTTSASTLTSNTPSSLKVSNSTLAQQEIGGDQLPTFKPGRSESQKLDRSKFRFHLRRIYNSWFGLAILIANILGAIVTLYVLTYLLMKNCDGSLNRENQNVRSMHLLAIIVVFFGSTLFIVSPTPGLCLLRASWHNFALVLLFGCLLSQTMQTRALRTLGLGGRPNRLNQFLNLVFLVGVQVSFELQRWKYESANYLNFVNQYVGSPDVDHKKLMILGNAIEHQFNPLDSFNDLVTPVSIQVSERYQNLLQDYCIQQTDDFMQSQIYLCIIVALAILFSFLTRNNSNYGANHHHHQRGRFGLLGLNRTLKTRLLGGKSRDSGRIGGGDDQMLAAATAAASLTSGKLVASEHEANLSLSSLSGHQHHQLTPSGVGGRNSSSVYQISVSDPTTIAKSVASFSGLDNGMVFIVSLLNGFIYAFSILLHIYGQTNGFSRDLISSITMVSIAFVTLIGVFLPILNQIHRFDKHKNRQFVSQHDQQISSTNSSSTSTIGDHVGKLGYMGNPKSCGGATNRRNSQNRHSNNLSSSAFTMFPEFSPSGLQRPTSIASLSGADSGSLTTGSGSRKPFAETKESRRKMGFTLANLAMDQKQHSNYIVEQQPDELPPMGFYDPDVRDALKAQYRDSSIIGMKLNQALLKDEQNHQHHSPALLADLNFDQLNNNSRQSRDTRQTKVKSVHRLSRESANMGNEKRLIMFDVDPCCPKHGSAARQQQHHNHTHTKLTN